MLSLSGRTEADQKVMITARAGGVLTKLNVNAVSTSRKARSSPCSPTKRARRRWRRRKALLAQRKTELDAKRTLIEKGTLPRLDLVSLESQFTAAQAAVASAEAEDDRGIVRAPWAGVITDVPAESAVRRSPWPARSRRTGCTDPMLAVVEVSERKLAGIKVGERAEVRLITGQTVTGRVRYVAKSASPTTRTYRVEVEIANPDGRFLTASPPRWRWGWRR